MAKFDEKGDLWIEVEIANLPEKVRRESYATSKHLGGGLYTAVTLMNLTEYVCRLAGAERR